MRSLTGSQWRELNLLDSEKQWYLCCSWSSSTTSIHKGLNKHWFIEIAYFKWISRWAVQTVCFASVHQDWINIPFFFAICLLYLSSEIAVTHMKCFLISCIYFMFIRLFPYTKLSTQQVQTQTLEACIPEILGEKTLSLSLFFFFKCVSVCADLAWRSHHPE